MLRSTDFSQVVSTRRRMALKSSYFITFLALASLAACSASGSSTSGFSTSGSSTSGGSALPLVRHASGSPGQYISHVVVIIQENRSFENFFAGYPKANAPMSGCAIPVSKSSQRGITRDPVRRNSGSGSGCPKGDISVALTPTTWSGPDLQHNWNSSKREYDKGKMDGFSAFGKTPYGAYTYIEQSLLTPYWTMANQYVLADAMFPTEFGGSFTGHLTLVAGNDAIKQGTSPESEVDFPNGLHDDCDSPPGTRSSYLTENAQEHYYQGPFPCFDQWDSMAQDLDKHGVSWKMYADRVLGAGMWEPFEAMKYVRYGQDWSTNIIAPQTKVLNDPNNGQLASVSWVTPSRPDSDHPGDGGGGPSWVASVVNAIGESPYWPTTAIVVVWDDWGGLYDNAPPPQLDYRGLGIRVPCLIISPYAKQNYVDHTQYEYASILSFMEEVFGLPRIGPASEGYTDSRATPLDNAFDFTQGPRSFTVIPSTLPRSHFLNERPSNEPVDTE
jgi:phospholipase C